MGACHVIGRLLTAIERNSGRTFTPEQRQFYRLAALLHDVGHYPFSHAMEKAVNNFYKGKAYLQLKKEDAQGGADPIPEDSPASFDHEGLGRQIIRCDPELIQILGRHNIDPEKVRSVFSSESPEWIVSLVSSDLDCDRLDYSMRTSHHAGLPYGSVDIEYIISQASLDDEGRLALTNKALRATDHLLISRDFDYLQVAFNKSVVALEWVLEDLRQSC